MPWALADIDLDDELLELGPGFGASTRVLAGRAGTLTVLELQSAYCERLRRGLGEQINVVEGDATAMPFGDDSFAAVVCFTMLHHVPSPEQQDLLFSEVTRVLRPGGVFAGSDSIGTGMLFRLLHFGDTLVSVPVEDMPARLQAAGLCEPRVSTSGSSFRFRANKPLLVV